MWLRSDCHYWIYTLTIVLSHLWLNITCQSDPGYDIQISPQRVTVQEGLSVLITCDFTANNKKTFSASATGYWTRCKIDTKTKCCKEDKNDSSNKINNIKLTGNPRNGDCSLTISDVKKQDAGNYIFRFDGEVKYYYYVKYLTVDVSDSPSINITTDNNGEIKNESVIVKEGTSLTVRCFVESNPKANVIWMKREKVTDSPLKENNLELKIQNITRKEAGTYVCSAFNAHGNSSRSVNISLGCKYEALFLRKTVKKHISSSKRNYCRSEIC
ncbi:sialic acid-binding Ig-like lectin 5 [Discoglossus pictus]